jgi:hypothetical protein
MLLERTRNARQNASKKRLMFLYLRPDILAGDRWGTTHLVNYRHDAALADDDHPHNRCMAIGGSHTLAHIQH